MQFSLTRRRLITGGIVAAAGTTAGYSQLRDRSVWSVNPYPNIDNPSYPKLFNRSLYVVFGDRVGRLNPDSGNIEQIWPNNVGESQLIKYPPAITDEEIFVGTDEGVSAYDIDLNKVRWHFKRSDLWETRVIVGDDFVFTGSGSGTFYCIDRENGSERWQVDFSSSVTGTPVYDSSVVYIPTLNAVYAVSYTGDLLWEAEVNGASQLMLSTDSVFVTDGSGVRKLNEINGDQQWEQQSSTVGPPVVGENLIFTGGSGATCAFNISDGGTKWNFKGEGSGLSDSQLQFGPPTCQDGVVYSIRSSGNKGSLYALDASSGEKQWQYRLRNPAHQQKPTIGDNRVFFTSNKGVHAVSHRPHFSL